MAPKPDRMVEIVRMTVSLFCVIALVAVTACQPEPSAAEQDYRDALAFDTGTVLIPDGRDTTSVTVELAVSEDQKRMGLMERRKLDENAGMLFVYHSLQPPEAGFWMYRTRLPLDIAFLDSTGIIRAINTMVPCETTLPQGCPSYPAGVPFRFALEVNQGFFRRRSIEVGDSVRIQASLAAMPGYTRSTGSP